jgi:TrmH family RNA methyltransferase
MLTNKQIKLINSLHSKKGRKENDLFLVEGEKSLLELVNSDFIVEFFVINDSQSDLYDKISLQSKATIYILDAESIQKLSTLVSNAFGLAVVQQKPFSAFKIKDRYTIVLDGIRDPGNLGTIIRICDWYGFKQLVLSNDCTEFYNPKVIISSMGSFSRIEFTYVDLADFFKAHPTFVKIGAVLNGENIHQYQFPENGFIIVGNESSGIRDEILVLLDDRITIPSYGNAESLNVGISTAVIADNLKRFLSS